MWDRSELPHHPDDVAGYYRPSRFWDVMSAALIVAAFAAVACFVFTKT